MAPLIEELTPAPDPVQCCEQLEGLPYRLFLDSAPPGARLGRYSFVMADPVAVIRTRGDAGALASVRQLLAPHRTESIDGLPPFQGGAAGYLAYDWGLTLERLPAPRFDDLGLDDAGHYRFLSSRSKANGPTFGDTGGAAILDGDGYWGQRWRTARRL